MDGLRVSEAMECYHKWLENPELKEVTVKVAKSKKDKYRLCIVEGLDAVDHKYTKHPGKPAPNNLQSWTIRHSKFNAHSLRYTFINYRGTTQRPLARL